MLKFKKLSMLTAAVALIFGLSFSTIYAQEKEQAPETDKYKLKVKVVDAESGDAVADAKVVIKGEEVSKETGKKGKSTFKKVPEGVHTVKVLAQGYQNWEKEIELTENSKLTIEVQRAT